MRKYNSVDFTHQVESLKTGHPSQPLWIGVKGSLFNFYSYHTVSLTIRQPFLARSSVSNCSKSSGNGDLNSIYSPVAG